MSIRNLSLGCLMIVLLLTSGCSKDSSKIATMQAKVNDSLVVCSKVSLMQDLGGTLWGVEGYTQNGLTGFKFLFPIGNGVGTYRLLSFNANYENEGWFQYDYDHQFKSTAGTVTVTEASSKKFKGIFSFPAESFTGEKKNITEGSFEISR